MKLNKTGLKILLNSLVVIAFFLFSKQAFASFLIPSSMVGNGWTIPDGACGSNYGNMTAYSRLVNDTIIMPKTDAFCDGNPWLPNVSSNPYGLNNNDVLTFEFYENNNNFGHISATWNGSTLIPQNNVTTADFNPLVYLPNNVNVIDGYNYNLNDFSDIKVDLVGTNSAGLYDHFYIDTLENGTKKNITPYSIVINSSCIDCVLGTFNLSDTGVIFRRGYQYQFNITMGSTLVDPIVKSFSLFFNSGAGKVHYETCTTGDIPCYLKNAFIWAFSIPDNAFDIFLDLRTDIEKKAPFGYLTSAYNAVLGIGITTDDQYELEQVTPISDLIFSPVRTGLSWFFYFLFIFALVRRFKNIQL